MLGGSVQNGTVQNAKRVRKFLSVADLSKCEGELVKVLETTVVGACRIGYCTPDLQVRIGRYEGGRRTS